MGIPQWTDKVTINYGS